MAMNAATDTRREDGDQVFETHRLTPHIGAEIAGLDLSRELQPTVVAGLGAA